MKEIHVVIKADGDQMIALVGENLQTGIAGYGKDILSALNDLAVMIEGDYRPDKEIMAVYGVESEG